MTATGSAVDGGTAPEYRLHGVRLEGKTALVTGGASGIGAATARRLAAEGARVAIGDIDVQGARELAGELDGFACELDVADVGSVRRASAGVLDAFGTVDVLVNNAGTDRFSFFVNTDEDLWDFVLGVNLRGVLAVTHALLPHMQERRSGAIVNVASEAGRVGSQGSAVYSAAKAGVIGFTKAIARESARYRVRCNAVAPRADRDAAAELCAGGPRRDRRAPEAGNGQRNADGAMRRARGGGVGDRVPRLR